MWTRKELKDKAKVSFKANYWKSVLVALVLMVVVVGVGVPSGRGMPATTVPSTWSASSASSHSPDNVNVEVRDGKVKVDVDDYDGGTVHVDLDADDLADLREVLDDIDVADEDIAFNWVLFGPRMALVGISVFLAMLVAAAIVIALYVFVVSPLEVGAQRFFIRNLNQPSEVKELAFGYDNNYKETVKTLFLRSLFIFLWSLLLIIPGIYKAYQYRMIPYLLADDPTMTKDRAFAESKRLMDGQKWNAFVLDLSFLGWNILSVLTLGILGAFYVAPYQAQTNAALYEKLAYGLPEPSGAQPTPGQGQPTPPASAAPTAAGAAPVATMPIIVSESQPPVPPFAAADARSASIVGVQPASMADATEELPETGENGDSGDSPEA